MHIVERLDPGGIETLVLDLVNHRGCKDFIFSLSGEADGLIEGWAALASIDRRLVSFNRGDGIHPRLVLAVAKRLRAIDPIAVIVHHIGPLIYGGTAARLAGVPCVVHVEHDAWHYLQKRRRTLFRLFSSLSGARHVAVSNEIAASVRSFSPRTSTTVIPPGVDMNRFAPADRSAARSRLGLAPDWKVIGTVGRLVTVKGHAVLIEALAGLGEPVHVAVVGGGPLRDELTELAERLGVRSRVHLFGPRDDVEGIYPAFDLFCLPSLAEGLPRAVLEAQACGIAVVASEVGGMKDAVCAATGMLVPPGDPQALAAALRTALTRDETISPRAHVLRSFSLEQTVAAYQRLIREAQS